MNPNNFPATLKPIMSIVRELSTVGRETTGYPFELAKLVQDQGHLTPEKKTKAKALLGQYQDILRRKVDPKVELT